MYTLNNVPVGDTCEIVAIHGTGPVRRRIMDMGITKRAKVKVTKLAPLGDPMELHVRGYQLSLRKEEARHIEVK